MKKNCLFNSNKLCDDCGDCNVCQFNSNKTCDNCSKCLELEGFDVKAINIDEVFEKNEDKIEESKSDSPNEGKVIALESKREEKIEANSDCMNDDELAKYEIELSNEHEDIMDNEEMWEYIDDVKDLSEILSDEKLRNNIAQEEFPGFLVLHKE